VNEQLKTYLSARTVQLSLVILRHALDDAVKWNLAPRNVAKLIDSPRVKRYKATPFTPEQARTFVAAVEVKRWGALYLTAVALGLREGELLAVKWSDIDFAKRTLTVNQTVQRICLEGVREKRKGSRLEFCETKTASSYRTLSLSSCLVAVLRAHRANENKTRLVAGSDWRDLDLVFTTSKGTPIEKSNLHRDYKKILKDAGLPSIRLHDLRHSCATLLLAQGVHPRALMEQLGHSRIGTTMDIYAHVMPPMLEDVANKMEAILG